MIYSSLSLHLQEALHISDGVTMKAGLPRDSSVDQRVSEALRVSERKTDSISGPTLVVLDELTPPAKTYVLGPWDLAGGTIWGVSRNLRIGNLSRGSRSLGSIGCSEKKNLSLENCRFHPSLM